MLRTTLNTFFCGFLDYAGLLVGDSPSQRGPSSHLVFLLRTAVPALLLLAREGDWIGDHAGWSRTHNQPLGIIEKGCVLSQRTGHSFLFSLFLQTKGGIFSVSPNLCDYLPFPGNCQHRQDR